MSVKNGTNGAAAMLNAVTPQPHIGDVARNLKSYVAARAISVGIEPNWLNA
jgi:hypothetical protein